MITPAAILLSNVALVASVATLACVIATLFLGSKNICSGMFVKALCRASVSRRVAALTFDDGPHPEQTPKILDVLKKHGVKAAFFVIGEKAEAHPEIVKRMSDEGHLIGNHTYDHSARFPLIGTREMIRGMERCDAVIEKITGRKPTVFRPPFGVTNPPIARAVRERGYTVAGWSVRSLDTMGRRSRENIFERVRRRLCPGSVILLHDDRPRSEVLLEMILEYMEQNNYKVERFDELFGL